MTRHFAVGGAVAATAVLAAVAVSPVAHAQEGAGTGPAGSIDSESLGAVLDEAPDEIVVGGPDIGAGSEGMRATGSGVVPDTAQSVGEVLGSVAPLGALGSTGGSAAASVASSGSLPGSVYANPTGSIGSGTIGLGSVAIPESVFPVLSVQLAAGYFTVMGARQEAAELSPDELDFWHGVVTGSARGGTAVEQAADAVGVEVPGPLAGSIDQVQESALEDPFEEQERRRAELEAEAVAAEAAGGAATAGGTGGAGGVAGTEGAAGTGGGDLAGDEATAEFYEETTAGADAPAGTTGDASAGTVGTVSTAAVTGADVTGADVTGAGAPATEWPGGS